MNVYISISIKGVRCHVSDNPVICYVVFQQRLFYIARIRLCLDRTFATLSRGSGSDFRDSLLSHRQREGIIVPGRSHGMEALMGEVLALHVLGGRSGL